MRLIDLDQAIRLIKIRMKWHNDYTPEEVIEDLESLPIENDGKSRPTGEWEAVEKPKYGNPYRHYRCSVCGNEVPYRVMYCDYCGSRNMQRYTKETVMERVQ